MDIETIIAELPTVIETNIPTFIKLLAITTPLTEEELSKPEYGLFEFVELTIAVVEVNRYIDIYNRIKKVSAHPVLSPVVNLTK